MWGLILLYCHHKCNIGIFKKFEDMFVIETFEKWPYENNPGSRPPPPINFWRNFNLLKKGHFSSSKIDKVRSFQRKSLKFFKEMTYWRRSVTYQCFRTQCWGGAQLSSSVAKLRFLWNRTSVGPQTRL